MILTTTDYVTGYPICNVTGYTSVPGSYRQWAYQTSNIDIWQCLSQCKSNEHCKSVSYNAIYSGCWFYDQQVQRTQLNADNSSAFAHFDSVCVPAGVKPHHKTSSVEAPSTKEVTKPCECDCNCDCDCGSESSCQSHSEGDCSDNEDHESDDEDENDFHDEEHWSGDEQADDDGESSSDSEWSHEKRGDIEPRWVA
jgi:hypothetical protein